MKNKDFTEFLSMTPKEFRKRQWSKGWALSFVGLIVYGVLRLFRQKPKDFCGICPYFEIGDNWGGLEFGWFFLCGKNNGKNLKCHEVGHGIQNAAVGGFTMLFHSIGSAFRYWYRAIFGAKTPYDSWWFEGQATALGTEYVERLINPKPKCNHDWEDWSYDKSPTDTEDGFRWRDCRECSAHEEEIIPAKGKDSKN